MDDRTLELFDASLRRCDGNPEFLGIFYDRFLASSPEVRARFAGTDFVRQKEALRASFHLLYDAARDGRPDRHLQELAGIHGAGRLNVGAELYDLWLDSLMEAVEECDPAFDAEVRRAWEEVTAVGVKYLLSHYHHPPG